MQRLAPTGADAAKAPGAIVFRPTPARLATSAGRAGAQVVLRKRLASSEGPLTNRRRSVRLGLCFLGARRYTKAPYGIVFHFFSISTFQRKQFEHHLAARPHEEVQAGSSGLLKRPLPGGIGDPTGKTSEGRCAELSKSPPARKADRHMVMCTPSLCENPHRILCHLPPHLATSPCRTPSPQSAAS